MDIGDTRVPKKTFRVGHVIKELGTLSLLPKTPFSSLSFHDFNISGIMLYDDEECRSHVKKLTIPVILTIKGPAMESSIEIPGAWKNGQYYPKDIRGFDPPGIFLPFIISILEEFTLI